jgi:hypothetical protein
MFSREKPISKTTYELAKIFAGLIVDGSTSLNSDLLQATKVPVDPESLEGTRFWLECLIFVWFLADGIIATDFAAHEDAFRKKLTLCLYDFLQETGASLDYLLQLDHHVAARFTEYSQTFLAATKSKRPLALGSLAWQHIAATEERNFIGASLLAAMAGDVIASLTEVASQYEVIEDSGDTS